jgi:hypothetical protein
VGPALAASNKTNEAVMSDSDNPELDEVLAKIDHRQAVQDLAALWGATYRQAKVFADSCADQFKTQGANLLFNGKSARNDEAVRAHFQKEYSFLIPTDDTSGVNSAVINRGLQDRAFVRGSPDARRDILKQLGGDKAKLNGLAASYGLKDGLTDYRRGTSPVADANGGDKSDKTPNPWRKGPGWSLTEQGRIYRSNPTLAASLAASARVDISPRRGQRRSTSGCTRPGGAGGNRKAPRQSNRLAIRYRKRRQTPRRSQCQTVARPAGSGRPDSTIRRGRCRLRAPCQSPV